jgi:predicted  nucleic acid-binding Zn-ribbon protein
MKNRDEYVEKLKAQLDHWNAAAAQWELKARDLQAESRQQFDKSLQAMRDQREQAMYQMNLLQAAAGDAWKDLVRGTDEAWAHMREACDKAGSHFRPG